MGQPIVEEVAAESAGTDIACYGVAAIEGVPDGADRTWLPGSLDWAPLPWSLKWQPVEMGEHDGSIVIGRVDACWRDGALIRWIGVIDGESEQGRELARQIGKQFIRGVSIKADDIDKIDAEYLYAPLAYAMPDVPTLDDDPNVLPGDDEAFHLPGKHDQRSHGGGKAGSQYRMRQAWKRKNPGKSYADASDSDAKRMGFTRSDRPDRYAAQGTVTAHGGTFDMDEPQACVYHHGRIRSLTVVAEPAYVECTISLGESPFAPSDMTEAGEEVVPMTPEVGMDEDVAEPAEDPIVAAGYTITIPEIWPESWFEEPTEAPEVGALTVTAAGRVYGYLAPGGVAHRAFLAQGQYITAPTGIDYSEFQNKGCIVAGADGGIYKINAGSITFDCGHASPVDPRRADPNWALQHYDNSCSIAARVRVGENRYGTWVAGGLLHGITPDAVERMMACALSGDWQGGKLKGALLVPVEGFPRAQTASVRVREEEGALSMVASAVPIVFEESGRTVTLTQDTYDALVAAAFADVTAERFAAYAADRFDEIERSGR